MSVVRGYVKILASQRNGTFYIGVTSDLVERIRQHKNWRRAWKLELMEQDSPAWEDLYEALV